jgi:hypothetical protein
MFMDNFSFHCPLRDSLNALERRLFSDLANASLIAFPQLHTSHVKDNNPWEVMLEQFLLMLIPLFYLLCSCSL